MSIKNYKFFIKQDTLEVGYYIYIYPENSTKYLNDYLQDSLEIAKKFIEKRYKIINDWKEVTNDPYVQLDPDCTYWMASGTDK